MMISLTKKEQGKAVLTCTRNDGTITWKHTDAFFISHDICHYAVETVLPLHNGFYGMLASGTDITEFDRPAAQRNTTISAETVFTEHLVNVFMIDQRQGGIGDICGMIANAFPQSVEEGLLLKLTGQKIDQIRQRYAALLYQWQQVADNSSLNLEYGK